MVIQIEYIYNIYKILIRSLYLKGGDWKIHVFVKISYKKQPGTGYDKGKKTQNRQQ